MKAIWLAQSRNGGSPRGESCPPNRAGADNCKNYEWNNGFRILHEYFLSWMGLRIYKSGKLAGLRTGCEGSFFLPPLRTNFYSFCSDALRLLLITSFSVCPEFGWPRTTKSAGTTKPAAFYSRVVRYSDFPKKDRCEMLPAE